MDSPFLHVHTNHIYLASTLAPRYVLWQCSSTSNVFFLCYYCYRFHLPPHHPIISILSIVLLFCFFKPHLIMSELKRTREFLKHRGYELDLSRPPHRGANSVVFKAKTTTTHASVAIKVIRKATPQSFSRSRSRGEKYSTPIDLAELPDDAGRLNFKRELAALRRVQKVSGICRFLEHFEDCSFYFIVTKYYSGGDLFDRISTHGPLHEPDALQITYQLLTALHGCHARGVVHGDVRLENIVLSQKQLSSSSSSTGGLAPLSSLSITTKTQEVDCRLVDFGSAKVRATGNLGGQWIARISNSNPPTLSSPSQETCTLGTEALLDWISTTASLSNQLLSGLDLNYLPPEFLCQSKRDLCNDFYTLYDRADVFALGVVLYVTLAGHMPYESLSWLEYEKKMSQVDLDMQHGAWCDVSDDTKTFVKSLLTQDPIRRPSAVVALHTLSKLMLKSDLIVECPKSKLSPLLDSPISVMSKRF